MTSPCVFLSYPSSKLPTGTRQTNETVGPAKHSAAAGKIGDMSSQNAGIRLLIDELHLSIKPWREPVGVNISSLWLSANTCAFGVENPNGLH